MNLQILSSTKSELTIISLLITALGIMIRLFSKSLITVCRKVMSSTIPCNSLMRSRSFIRKGLNIIMKQDTKDYGVIYKMIGSSFHAHQFIMIYNKLNTLSLNRNRIII